MLGGVSGSQYTVKSTLAASVPAHRPRHRRTDTVWDLES